MGHAPLLLFDVLTKFVTVSYPRNCTSRTIVSRTATFFIHIPNYIIKLFTKEIDLIQKYRLWLSPLGWIDTYRLLSLWSIPPLSVSP